MFTKNKIYLGGDLLINFSKFVSPFRRRKDYLVAISGKAYC